jgi:redox-sensitive bicupin YhaK (pirin superfamily)
MHADASPALYGATLATEAEPGSVLLPGHDIPLGRYTTVRRLLPQRPRRMVGAWCFVDHFGPDDVTGRPGMQIAPHPHTGLQTVTWLVAGSVLHRDSIGSMVTIGPGQMNLMTSGCGIAHSEESPAPHPPLMHGLQLWIALPDAARAVEPSFATLASETGKHFATLASETGKHFATLASETGKHVATLASETNRQVVRHADLPVLADGGMSATVLVGALGALRSPAQVHSPLVGAEIRLAAGATGRLPLELGFEHAALVMTGAAEVAGTTLTPGSLLYLDRGRTELAVGSAAGARLFLLGGEPFEEPLVMWWNFVGRTHEEIAQARDDWMAGRRFGVVHGYAGDPLPAPEMPTVRLKARARDGRILDR